MAITWNPTPENIRKEIKQIDFILANPADPVSKIFMEIWKPYELKERREHLQKLLFMSPRRRALVLAQIDINKTF